MKINSLKNKILFLVVGSMASLVVALVVFSYPVLFKKLEKELLEEGVYIAGFVADESPDYLLTGKYKNLQLQINDYMGEDDDLYYIFVVDKDGKVAAHSFESGFPAGLKDANLVAADSEQSFKRLIIDNIKVYDVAMPILNNTLGTVHVGMVETVIRQGANAVLITMAGIASVALVVAFLVASLFAERLARPLLDLVQTTEKISERDLDTRVQIQSSDEIGQLGMAFNKMIASLKQSTVSKEDYQNQTAFLSNILESIPHPFYVINADTYNIEMANSAVADHGEWRNRKCHELTHKQKEPCGVDSRCICPLEEVKKSKAAVTVEHVHVDADGHNKYFEVHGFPIFDDSGRVARMIEFSRDITDRKVAEKALLESREQLAIVNLEINEQRDKLQKAVEAISVSIQQVIHEKKPNVRLENANLTKCYETKHCEQKDCPCYGGEASMRCWQIAGTFCGGEVQGGFAKKFENCMDCEVFKEATQDPISRVGEYFNNMMHVLDAQSSELQTAYNDLKSAHSQMLQQEKMASVGQLAAGVAHEINNPMGFVSSNLSTLNTYVDRLSEFIKDQASLVERVVTAEEDLQQLAEKRKKLKIDYVLEDVSDLLAESLDGTARITTIVRNLKSFSRIDEATISLSDINECLESTLNIVWNELKYNCTVKREYGELPNTYCNSQQLNQVFMNMLINASHAIEKQGDVTLQTWVKDDKINIAISDTGCGIPEDKINRIFEPFFTTKPVGKGTGLGMSIAYDIIQKHEGDIFIASEVGKGTTFTVSLPVVFEPPVEEDV